jgi:hypothetical protein
MTEAAILICAPIERVAPDAIRLERTLDAPVETVWRYLTEAELRRQWFMGGGDVPATGEFDLVVDHDNLSDEPAPYPESYALSKARYGPRRSFASIRRSCSKPPSRAARTAP